MTVTWAECEAYLREHCSVPGLGFPDETLRYALVLWTLTQCAAARTILEIGIGPQSVSGCTFLHAMAPGGTLYSMDIEPSRPSQVYQALAREKGHLWFRQYGDSLSPEMRLPNGVTVDLLYVDGDHDEAHAIGDTLKFWPALRPGGFCVIDDYPDADGVRAACQRLGEAGLLSLHLSHTRPPSGNGHLVLQKPWRVGTHGERALPATREATASVA